MFSNSEYVDKELSKQGLKLTDDGRRFYEVFVLCGDTVSVPEHQIEKL